MKFDGTTFTNFIIGSLYLYVIILLVLALYLGWKYYHKKSKREKTKISPKVAKEMAKKIAEEAAMHRKERQEE